jgi:hypothetical protein
MRILLFFALALGACAPEPPEAALVERPTLEPLVYVCTPEGEEMIAYAGELLATDRACDYAAWRAHVEIYGPVRTRLRQGYGDWLAARERGA